MFDLLRGALNIFSKGDTKMKLTFDDSRMMVAAHRGDSYNFFENTMEAYREAVKVGADMIEIDVRLTKDLVPVLIHDEKVDRTTDSIGYVRDFTYEELNKINAGGKYDFQNIPKLEELLQLIKETGVLLNLELKEYYVEGNEERCDNCIDQCIELIEKYDLADKMVFNSFDAHCLEYVAEKGKGKYMLHGFYPYDRMRNVKRNPDEYLYCACIFDDRVKEHYDYLISKNIEPWIGAGVTKTEHFRECYEYGARLVTTNYTADCFEKLKKIGAR